MKLDQYTAPSPTVVSPPPYSWTRVRALNPESLPGSTSEILPSGVLHARIALDRYKWPVRQLWSAELQRPRLTASERPRAGCRRSNAAYCPGNELVYCMPAVYTMWRRLVNPDVCSVLSWNSKRDAASTRAHRMTRTWRPPSVGRPSSQKTMPLGAILGPPRPIDELVIISLVMGLSHLPTGACVDDGMPPFAACVSTASRPARDCLLPGPRRVACQAGAQASCRA